ncbi:MAG: hypothetical protein ACRC6K_08425 [Fusobacteriaceae bacterium]
MEVTKIDGKRKRVERVGGVTKNGAKIALREALKEYETDGCFIAESNISVSVERFNEKMSFYLLLLI